jgi:hypothetical protein
MRSKKWREDDRLAMVRIARSAICVLTTLLVAGQVVAGCGNPSPAPSVTGTTVLATQVPLYIIDEQGRVLRAHFGAPRNSWELINDTGLAKASSPDADGVGRLVLHGGTSPGESQDRYWLLDLHSGIDRPVPVTQPGGDRAISPNGDAITRLIRLRDDGEARTVVEWIDTTTLEVRHIEVPVQAQRKLASGYPDYSDVDWTDAGDLVYSVGNEPRRFFVYSEADASFRAVEGYMEQGPGIVLDGKPLRLRGYSPIPPGVFSLDIRSADGWRAKVGEDYALHVLDPDGGSTFVAKGRNDDCEGLTIGVLGWADGHGILVYELDHVVYAFEVARETHVKLFAADSFRYGGFAWEGWHRPDGGP